MGHLLPSTRFTLMDRMVKRACSEHKYAIRIEGQDVAPRLLGALAMRLTDLEKTEDVVTQILPTIVDEIDSLKREGELSAPPPSRSVLTTLANSHLIVLEESRTSIRFSHQLVQEFFAAKALASYFLENGIAETENRLTKWAWAVPIQMCIECLAQSGHDQLAASLVNRLVELDIEAASRALGANPTLWESARNSLETRIRSLSESIDVNARWLAAHCAGATGQPTFDQIVFEGLGGLPAKSGFVYAGLPIDIVFRSLGPGFTTRLLSYNDNDFRFRALTHLATPGSVDGLRLAHELAMHDPDPIIRRNAYQLLFAAGDAQSWRPFVAEVKRQGGWESGLLAVARNCSSLPIGCWRKLQLKLLQSNQDWRQRKKIYIRWANADHDGAYPHAKAEYLWCISQSKNEQIPFEEETILHYRLYCLRVAGAIEPEWASERAMEEVAVPGFDKLGAIPREALSDEQRATLVKNRIEHFIGSGPESVKFLATFSPETAARWILRQVSNPNFLHLHSDRRWSIMDALQQVDRLAQLKVACEAEFAQPDQSMLPHLIDTLARGRGDQRIVWDTSLNGLWRQRLEVWLKLLPPIDHDSAAIWSNIASLLGEIGRSDDASLLIKMLKADEAQCQRRTEKKIAEVEEYRTSGGRTKPPGGIDACSYQPSYHHALWELQGESVSREIAKLLTDPREVAFASHWLASHFGAPQPNESGYGSSRYRYDLIYERRHRTQAFRQSTSTLLTQLKLTIDQQLDINGGKTFQGLRSSLVAVARLEGASSGTWIMDRLEQYFPDGRWHELLHEIILVGAEISGRRLLPFAKGTIHDILHSNHPQNDQSWRFRQVITVLFYTDAPELAIRLFNDHAQIIFHDSDYPIQLIIREVIWSNSNTVDSWLRAFFDPAKSEPLRAASMEVFIDRIVGRKAFGQLLEAVYQFIELGDLRRSEGAWSISSKLARIADDHTDIQKAILAAARTAPTLEHAQRWLFLITNIGAEESVLAALDITEKWGEAQMNVVSSLYPDQQTGASVGFHGSFANWRRTFHRLPNVMSRLRGMTASDDPILSDRAQRALNWIERERLGGGQGSLG